MNVYSYFEHLNDVALPVIELWKTSWSEHGWKPVLLGEVDFLSWPGCVLLDQIVSRFPTVNNRAYERACFRRWGAMVAVGGGVMTDYDVMNYGFTPEALPTLEDRCRFLDANSPCVTIGTAMAFQRACDYFCDYELLPSDLEYGVPHVSDMHLTNKWELTEMLPRLSICKEIHEPGWETSPLVHFASLKTRVPKAAAIRAKGTFKP